jgi:hypothetical protein
MSIAKSIGLVLIGAIAGLGLAVGVSHHAFSAERPNPKGVQHSDIVAVATEEEVPFVPQIGTSTRAAFSTNTALPRVAEPSPAAGAAVTAARHLADLQAHKSEPSDRAWRVNAEGVFQDELDKLRASMPFEISQIDCKTTTCLANCTFADAQAARIGIHRLAPMALPSDINCMREAWTASPDDVEVYFMLDCKDQRASQVR